MNQQIRLRIVPILVASFLLAARIVSAQTSNATLQGAVTDSGGGVMPGVSVRLESPTTGLERDVVTNEAGVYVFNFLPAGSYTVIAELAGFKSVRQDDVVIEIGQTRELKVTLEVGRVEEVVTVEGTAAVLDRSSPSIGTVIGSSQLKQLPLAGRHWATLMMLAPGAINTGDGTHLSIGITSVRGSALPGRRIASRTPPSSGAASVCSTARARTTTCLRRSTTAARALVSIGSPPPP